MNTEQDKNNIAIALTHIIQDPGNILTNSVYAANHIIIIDHLSIAERSNVLIYLLIEIKKIIERHEHPL